jgi:hypothetical protein
MEMRCVIWIIPRRYRYATGTTGAVDKIHIIDHDTDMRRTGTIGSLEDDNITGPSLRL